VAPTNGEIQVHGLASPFAHFTQNRISSLQDAGFVLDEDGLSELKVERYFARIYLTLILLNFDWCVDDVIVSIRPPIADTTKWTNSNIRANAVRNHAGTTVRRTGAFAGPSFRLTSWK